MFPLNMRIICVVIFVASMGMMGVKGHGYLAVPGARNSMWRLGFDTPKNFNDMGLNCGGASNQWETHGGKCGLCGDPYQAARPRAHEAGGEWAPITRPVSRCYNKRDNVIDVTVRITAHHKGYMEFRLCENNNLVADPEPDCIDNGRLLTIAGTQDTRYDISDDVMEFYVFQLDIPQEVTCTQCILHWKYNAGNSYGCDSTGCGMGLGPQEQFINCADIAILPDCQDEWSTLVPPSATTPSKTGTTKSWETSSGTGGSTATSATSVTSFPATTTDEPEVTTDDSSSEGTCKAAGSWTGDVNMDNWCNVNCLHPTHPYCPESHCECDN